MERNYSSEIYNYYKEPINCQTNVGYNEMFLQSSHVGNNSVPYDPEYKDRRYAQQNNIYYDGSYKQDANHKIDKNLQGYRPTNHVKHNGDVYCPPYYDQYKMNVNLPHAPNIPPQPTKNYPTNQYAIPKIPQNYCEENAIQPGMNKNSLQKPSNCQVPGPQYMYSNCYNYSGYTNGGGYTNPTSGYCAYQQNCNDENKIYWDDYQNSRRHMQSNYSQSPLPQSNCSLKDNHPSLEFYKTNAFPCQTDNFLIRDKTMYSSVPHASSNDSAYNSRAGWPTPLQYQGVPSHLSNTFDRSNFYHDSQNFDCCGVLPSHPTATSQQIPQSHHPHAAISHSLISQQRQEGSSNFLTNYGKYLSHPPSHSMLPQVNHQKYTRSQHQHPAAAPSSLTNNNLYNSQKFYMYNEQNNAVMNSYQQTYSKDEYVPPQSNLIYNLDTNETNVNVTYSIEDKNAVYKNYQGSQTDVYNAYSKSGYHNNLMNSVYHENQKNQLNRSQNLREFLSTWNEDEDDGCEKLELSNNGDLSFTNNGLCNNLAGVMNTLDYDINGLKKAGHLPGSTTNQTSAMENHLQFKSTFATRPKIHVGITVDGNVSNSQYINLPDIIIDIEKSKEVDNVSQIAEANSKSPTLVNGPKKVNDKVFVLESQILAPASDTFSSCAIAEENVNDTEIMTKDKKESIDDDTRGVDDMKSHSKVNNSQSHTKMAISKESKVHKKIKKPLENVKRKDNRHWKKKFKHIYASEHNINLKKLAKWKKMKKMKMRSKLLHIKKISKKKPKVITHTSNCNKIKKQTSFSVESLKTLCVNKINTEEFRNLMLSTFELNITAYQTEYPSDMTDPEINAIETLLDDYEEHYHVTMLNDNEYYHSIHNSDTDNNTSRATDPSKVPKLSALCEYALKDVYDQNLFIINLDDENLSSSNNIYLVECDVNENITDFEEITPLPTTLDENPNVALLDDDLPKTSTEIITCETQIEAEISCDTNTNNEKNYNDSNNNNNYNNNTIINNNNNHTNNINNGDHILKDLSSIHHEEIVPENYELFKNQNLRNYLHNKYVQKTNFLQVIVINKILKKYQRYITNRRRGKICLSKNSSKRLCKKSC